MLTLPRRARPTKGARPATVPDGMRVYAIGDVHGRIDLLDDLLRKISADHESRGGGNVRLIFVGDLIDRGPRSDQVVECVRQLMENDSRISCLMGNHEELLLLALKGDQKAMRLFTRIGGRETLLSYGITAAEYHSLSSEDLLELMRTRIPATHVRFLESLDDYIEVGDYAFVHAGIQPGIPLPEQRASDLRWIREPFLSFASDHGKVIVHGHTVTREVEERPFRIGIDTGAVVNGKLTAIALECGERWFLAAEAESQIDARYSRQASRA